MTLGQKLALSTSIAICLAMVATAQSPQTPPKPAAPPNSANPKAPEQFDKIHESVFSKTDKSQEAGKLTDDASKALPGRALAGPIPRKNYIDEHIFGRIERDKIPHAGLSTDEEFIRRVYIDATGMLPTAEDVRQFVASKQAGKRDTLIDKLVGSKEFADQWAWYWADLFRQNDNGAYFWLREWLRIDRPYNEVVKDLLTGGAKTHTLIPGLTLFGDAYVGTNQLPTSPDDYAQLNRLDTLDYFSIDVARIFLGMNTSCVSCHDGAGHLEPVNSYLANRTRQEFYSQAAFFGKVRMIAKWDDRAKNNTSSDLVIDENGNGYDTGHDAPYPTMAMNQYPRDGKVHTPAFMLTGEKPDPNKNPRAELARMITSHPQFRRATVNLVWGKLMTVGFVEPYDGFDMDRVDPKKPLPKGWTIQPTNPELLEAMQEDFGAHNFSVNQIIKTIMKSSAYQLSTQFPGEWKPEYTNYYPRRFVRVLSGPEVIDVLTQATGRPVEFDNSGLKVTRVTQLSGPGGVGGGRRGGGEGLELKNILQSFFQSNRSTPAPLGNKASTLQALLLMSSKAVNDRVLAEKGSRVQQLLESGKTDDQIVDELFLSSLSRWPLAAEKEVALRYMGKDRKTGAENLQWVLLNGTEFVLNH
jgi:hypothetical protein